MCGMHKVTAFYTISDLLQLTVIVSGCKIFSTTFNFFKYNARSMDDGH